MTDKTANVLIITSNNYWSTAIKHEITELAAAIVPNAQLNITVLNERPTPGSEDYIDLCDLKPYSVVVTDGTVFSYDSQFGIILSKVQLGHLGIVQRVPVETFRTHGELFPTAGKAHSLAKVALKKARNRLV